jgi:hypothetical protein
MSLLPFVNFGGQRRRKDNDRRGGPVAGASPATLQRSETSMSSFVATSELERTAACGHVQGSAFLALLTRQ